jgi:hypothetical protein
MKENDIIIIKTGDEIAGYISMYLDQIKDKSCNCFYLYCINELIQIKKNI